MPVNIRQRHKERAAYVFSRCYGSVWVAHMIETVYLGRPQEKSVVPESTP